MQRAERHIETIVTSLVLRHVLIRANVMMAVPLGDRSVTAELMKLGKPPLFSIHTHGGS